MNEKIFYCWSRKRANSIAFNNDGTRMVVAGAGNIQNRIHEYSLSTGFDLSSTELLILILKT